MTILIFLLILISTLTVILLPVVGLGVLVFKEGETPEVVIPVPPSIEVDTTSLIFNTVGTAIPPTQDIAITNGGGGGEDAIVGLTATGLYSPPSTSFNNWLSLNLNSFTTPSVLTVGVDPTASPALPPGTYNANINISSTTTGLDVITIPLEFTVSAP